MKIIFMQGLQGSGKSTWAKYKALDPLWKRVNRDDLRVMLDNQRFNPENEDFVTIVEDQIISSAISNGYNVIIDSMNLNPKRIKERFEKISLGNKDLTCEIKSYTDVSLGECLRRDSLRSHPVGEAVIIKTYKKYFNLSTGELL